MTWTTKERREELRRAMPIPDLDKLPDGALLTERQVSLVSGFAEITLRTWRMKRIGPDFVLVQGRPRYVVGRIRTWMAGERSSKKVA